MARGKEASDEEIEVDEAVQEDQAESGEEEEEESEYEIEKILDAKHGAFSGGKIGYFVKWKNYDESNNSWVNEDDAGNAEDLIAEYWRTHAKKGRKSETKQTPSASAKKRKPATHASDEESEPAPKKRGRPSKSKTVSEEESEPPATKKAPRKSGGATSGKKRKAASPETMDEGDDDTVVYESMKKWADAPSWVHLVEHIDTVERQQDGKLYVYFRLKQTGALCKEPSEICKKKMPQLLLDFYERNLRWRFIDIEDPGQ